MSMSWLARSLANHLIPDPQNPPPTNPQSNSISNSNQSQEEETEEKQEEIDPSSRGVKEDISDLTHSLSLHFRSVASFLAPPPSPSDPHPTPPDHSNQQEEQELVQGMRTDFAEIGGTFKSGISRLSNSEIGKMASNLNPFFVSSSSEHNSNQESEDEEEEEYEVIGLTEEVLVFARNIAMHPETWLDFPLFNEFEESEHDFDMSSVQHEHALAVESLEPRLAALRIELCPNHMSEGCFWKIYFVLLHSRLNKQDAELLSTPQIAEARAMLLSKLQNQAKPEPETYNRGLSYRNEASISASHQEHAVSHSFSFYETCPTDTHPSEGAMACLPLADPEEEKHRVHATEIKIIDKSIIKEEPDHLKAKDLHRNSSEISINYDEDGDDWLEEDEVSGNMGSSLRTTIPLGNEEDVSFSDVSFSDLEEDDEPIAPWRSKMTAEAKKHTGRVQSSTSSEQRKP